MSELEGAIGIGVVNSDQELIAEMANNLRRKTINESRINFLRSFDNIAYKANKVFTDDSAEKNTLERLKQFRNYRLAHPLFDKKPDKSPSYNDLKLLIGLAMEIFTDAILIIKGRNIDLNEHAKQLKMRANGFSECVVDGLKRAGNT